VAQKETLKISPLNIRDHGDNFQQATKMCGNFKISWLATMVFRNRPFLYAKFIGVRNFHLTVDRIKVKHPREVKFQVQQVLSNFKFDSETIFSI